MSERVFGIGLGRTGTTSLTRALEILGYRAKHCPRFYLDPENRLQVSEQDIAGCEALTDEPVALIYKRLDLEYPGSKFILTIREMESWLASRANNDTAMQPWWARNPAVPVLHKALYGVASFDRRRYTEAYRRYVEDVQFYFVDRPADLLVMDICAGEGWEKLCPFLDRPVPDEPFPRLNVFNESDYGTIIRDLKARGRE